MLCIYLCKNKLNKCYYYVINIITQHQILFNIQYSHWQPKKLGKWMSLCCTVGSKWVTVVCIVCITLEFKIYEKWVWYF